MAETLLDYVSSLQDQNISGPKMFEMIKEWKISNPDWDKSAPEEVEASVDINQGLSVNNPPFGSLAYYENRVKNLKLSVDEQAEAINNMAMTDVNGQPYTDTQQRIQVFKPGGGFDVFTSAQIQQRIDSGDEGFQNTSSVEDYIQQMGNRVRVITTTPDQNIIESDGRPVQPLEPVEVREHFTPDPAAINEQLGHHVWYNESFNQRFGPTGERTVNPAAAILGEYMNNEYDGGETQLTSLTSLEFGRETGASGQNAQGGVTGYADIEELSGNLFSTSTMFEEKYGRNKLNPNDRLITLDKTGGLTSKYRSNFSKMRDKKRDRLRGTIQIVNVPNQEAYRLNYLNQQARENNPLTNDEILEHGYNILSPEYQDMALLIKDYENMSEDDPAKKDLENKILEYAEDENLGNRLYDPNTGELVDVKSADAPMAAIELYNAAEDISATDKDVLVSNLANTNYDLVGLASDIIAKQEYLTEQGLNLSVGNDSFMYSDAFTQMDAFNQDFITKPQNITDTQLKLLKEYVATGKMPKGLTKVPMGTGADPNPLLALFNSKFDDYVVTNKALQLNANLATTVRTYGFDELFDKTLNTIGAGDITTQNEEANVFADALQNSGFDINTDAISYSTMANFGQRNLGGIPHFMEFLFKVWGTNKITGLSKLTKSFKEIGKGFKVFKDSPGKYKAYTSSLDVLEETLKFEGAGLLFDEQYQVGSGALFGGAMKTGQVIYAPFGNMLSKRMSQFILSPRNQALAANPFYRGFTDNLTRVSQLETVRGTATTVGGSMLGAGTYIFASTVTDPKSYFAELDEKNIGIVQSYADEITKMIIAGKLSKGIPGMESVKNAVAKDIITLTSGGKSSKMSRDAAKFFEIDNKNIENPDSESIQLITDNSKAKTKDLLERRKKEEISEEDARKEFDEIKRHERAALTQIAVNSAREAIDKERDKGNLTPSDGEISVIANKIMRGERLSASEAAKLDNIPKELLYQYTRTEVGTQEGDYLEYIFEDNRRIQHQLNGGGLGVSYRGVGKNAETYFMNNKLGEYNVSEKLTPELYNEAYEFLYQKNKLNRDIRVGEIRLKNKLLTESEKTDLKNEIEASKEKLKEYETDGTLYENLQTKLKDSSENLLTEDTNRITDLKGGSSKVINDIQEFQDIYDGLAKEYGLEAKDVKSETAFVNPVTGESFINKTIAAEIKDFSVARHEDIHKIFLDVFKDSSGKVTEEGIELIDNVLNMLSPKQKRLIETTVESRYNTSKPKNEWYEENLTIFGELVDRGQIKFGKTMNEALTDLVPLFKKKLPNLEVDNITPEAVFGLFKKLSTNVDEFYADAERFAREAADAKGETDIAPTQAPRSSTARTLNPLGIEMFKLTEGKNRQERTDIVRDFFDKNPQFRDQIYSAAADALGFKVGKGTKSQEDFEGFVNERIFQPLLRFNPRFNKDGVPRRNLTNFIYANFKPKRQAFYESIERDRITDSADRQKEEVGREIVETEEMDVNLEGRPDATEGLAKKPTETAVYKPEAIDQLNISADIVEQKRKEGKSDTEIINEHISEVIGRNYEGVDITKFKDAKVTKEIAQLYADMFGLETVAGLTSKARNFPKKDADALTRIRQFLIDNSVSDFARLPKTVDMLGRGTGVYQTKIGKAMYDKNGNLIGTLKDYRDILQGKNVTVNGIEFNAVGKDGKIKPIYRGDLQASIKFGMDMHVRNRIMEETVESTGERGRMGVKFSQSEMDIPLSSTGTGLKGNTFAKRFNALFEEMGIDPISDNVIERNESTRSFILNKLVDKFGDLTPELYRFFGSGGKIPRKGKTILSGTQAEKRGEGNVLQQVASEFGVDSPQYKAVEKGLKDGSLVDISDINAEVVNEIQRRGITETRITDYEAKIFPGTERKYTREEAENAVKEEDRKISLALKTPNPKTVETTVENLQDIKDGKKLIFDKFREIAKEDPNNIKNLVELVYSGTSTNSPFRKFAQIMGVEKDFAPDAPGRAEHLLQYGVFSEAFLRVLNAPDSVYEGFKEYIIDKDNYYQLKISEDQRTIIDQESLTKDRETGEELDKFSPKHDAHPEYLKLLDRAIKGEIPFSSLPDVRMRLYNRYIAANPNILGKSVENEEGEIEFKSDAKDFDVVVDSKFERNEIVINEQANLIDRIIRSEAGLITEDSPLYLERGKQSQEAMDSFMKLESTIEATLKSSKDGSLEAFGNKDPNIKTPSQVVTHVTRVDAATAKAKDPNTPLKQATVSDVDGTMFNDNSKVIAEKDGEKMELNPFEFGEMAERLGKENWKFNFDEFATFKGGEEAAYFKRFRQQYNQHGGKNMFLLSARPQSFAKPMHEYLKSKYKMDIPIENIVGLGNGTPIAKANWFVQKAAEGFNRFEFADDVLPNIKKVNEVLQVVDKKYPIQVSLSSKADRLNKRFNENLELKTTEMGNKVGADWQISDARARVEGRRKNLDPFTNFFMGYSAEDFNGLLYATLPKGEAGNEMIKFYQENLIDPFNAAERKIESAKIAASSDFKELKNRLTTLPKSMNQESGVGGFSFGDAARVAIWTEQGMDIPGLSKRDQKALNKFVQKNPELSTFVQEVIKIQKGKPYPKPDQNWVAGTMSTDIMGEINKSNRKEYLQEWQQNVDAIFSKENMNKLRFTYGDKYVEALENTLSRMKSGNNRSEGGSRTVNNMLDWVNGSVGATMFLNTRSAALQTISAVNYLNWSDNNILNAGKAFANQKQYWKDFTTLFNSDYLVNRREGLQINVSESEIADMAKKGGVKGAIGYLLNKGFIMTRGADSFAIASGGATFYRNRIISLQKQGFSKEEAERKAFDDFRKISEENQQSSSPMRISQQQASGGGRLILAFKNTPMQYARIIKRSTQDLIAGRGDWKTNVSKIVYYGAAQNIIFNGLQNAVWTEAFDEDGDGTEKGARTANGMVDSLLGGLGFQGSAAVAIKNSLITIAKESGKDSPEFRKAVNDLLDFSPPIDVKARKLISAANTFSWERQAIKEEGFNLNNPAYLATAQVVSAATNVPADRAIQKINNTRMILSDNSEKWQKIALALGWSTWDVGLPYYGVPSTEPLSPERIMENREIEMRQNTNTREQKKMLQELGLTNKEIKALRYEKDRVKKIIALQDKKKKDEEKNKTGGR